MEGLEQKLKEINDELATCQHAAEQANYVAGLASIRISELWGHRMKLLKQANENTHSVKPTGKKGGEAPLISITPLSKDASLLKITEKPKEKLGGGID